MYQTKALTGEYFKIFSGVYNDFRENSAKDYNFEVSPIEYQDFINCFEKGYIKCIMLLEDGIPTGFCAYSTQQEDVVELFIIHFLGDEDLKKKFRMLLTAFMQDISKERQTKIVEYPMLGRQKDFRIEVSSMGYNFVDLGVVKFDVLNKDKTRELLRVRPSNLPLGFKIISYKENYLEELASAIHLCFKNASDTKFDPRFLTIDGCLDIAQKITTSFYGKFIEDASKILLHENKLVGFCLSNITEGKIGNIPLVGIIPEFQKNGMSSTLLKSTLDEIIRKNQNGLLNLSEVNASVDLANIRACRMYRAVGFEEDYTYPQAYLEKISV
ncbi:MAG: GNAT family N-acetyltransferase [Cyanobacteria bacterium SIG30]|nr:GNAT family N-acetyltransferase [Cyanobacteria bacterium SIG30]